MLTTTSRGGAIADHIAECIPIADAGLFTLHFNAERGGYVTKPKVADLRGQWSTTYSSRIDLWAIL